VDALFAPEVKSPDISDLSTETRDVLAAAILKAKESVQLVWRTALKKIDDAEVIELEKLSAVIDTVEANPTYLKGVEIIQKNEALKALESTLSDQRGALSIVDRVTEEITRLADRDSELRREILELNFKYYTEAERLSANLTSTLSGGEVVIEAYPRILLEGYNNRLQYAINLQSYDRKDEATFTPGLDEKESFKEQLADKFTKALANELKLKNQYSAFRFLQDIIAECHVSISYRVTYEGDEYETMSEGKQAFIILRLLLDNSDKSCPILIDQPEDDLDNRAIYTDLVKYIRRKKLKRQIILATHNPNIVVGTDAELVIVANQHGTNSPNSGGSKFEYLSGSLEHSVELNNSAYSTLEKQGVREHVCEILEGGIEAFRSREQRYRLKDSV
jgi:hypothetical protein